MTRKHLPSRWTHPRDLTWSLPDLILDCADVLRACRITMARRLRADRSQWSDPATLNDILAEGLAALHSTDPFQLAIDRCTLDAHNNAALLLCIQEIRDRVKEAWTIAIAANERDMALPSVHMVHHGIVATTALLNVSIPQAVRRLANLAANLQTGETPGELPRDLADEPALSEAELDILTYLNDQKTPRIQSQILNAIDAGTGTVKAALTRLEQLKMVDRPLGKRKGYRITQKARDRLYPPPRKQQIP